MLKKRKQTRRIYARNLAIGGGAPVSVQSMANKPAADISAINEQIAMLSENGCELVRIAVPDVDCALKIGKIIDKSPIPVCADVHFDWRIAMEVLNQGIDKLRLNPGNLQKKEKLAEITKLASTRKVPIRIGVNSGSLDKKLLKKYGSPNAEALFESAETEIAEFDKLGFHDIVISIKTFSLPVLLQANRMISEKFDYPLHLGVTEAGTAFSGSIRSAAALAILLNEGIGDTIRVSLTDDPIKEVRAAWEILKALELRKRGATVISCPGCGRTAINIYELAEKVNDALLTCKKEIKVAVMGCVVNGPGEAREADVGIAGGKGEGIIFRKGKIIRKLPESELFSALVEEIEKL